MYIIEKNGQILNFFRESGGIIRPTEIFFETFWVHSSGGFEGPETFLGKVFSPRFISLHFLFHLISSCPLSSLLSIFSSLVFDLLFHLHVSLLSSSISSFLLFHLLVSSLLLSRLLFSCLVSLSLSLSMCLSVSVSVWCCVLWCCVVCVLCVCVLCCVCGVVCVLCVCVVFVVWCVARLGTQKKPPCVDSQRPRVYQHHAHMCYHMRAWCRYTRRRFESTHGGF